MVYHTDLRERKKRVPFYHDHQREIRGVEVRRFMHEQKGLVGICKDLIISNFLSYLVA